jgi:plasmid stabilization system protein ParE
MRRVTISQSAQDDIHDVRQFYDDQERGVGDYFFQSIKEDIESLRTLHGIHRKHGNLHRMNATIFPHFIYYREDAEETYVVAVLDQRRDPQWIRRQLRNR